MAWAKRIGIMLCQPVDEKNLERNFKAFPSMMAQPKLDGMRCWVKWEGDTPRLISSQGELIMSVPHIELALKDFAHITGLKPELDGELYAHHMVFEKIISICKRHAENLHPDYMDMQYHVFDYKSTALQVHRANQLQNWFVEWVNKADLSIRDTLKKVYTTPTTREGIEPLLQRFIDAGYEGIILRNPLASYVERRPYTILKWKPSKSDWYKIIDVEEAVSEDGIRLGRIGALVCEDDFGNTFKCGSGLGLTHADTERLWRDRQQLIGKYARVFYQNLTNAGVPRFGKFTTIEIDKTSGERH